MIATPGARKFLLTTHVATSVAWLGSVASFLALSMAALNGSVEIARSAYLSMNLIGAWVIVPLSLAALLSGVWIALITPWGLIRHYWVLTKLALTIVATLLLLLHQYTAVEEAAQLAGSGFDVGHLGRQLVMDATLGIAALVATTVLSVYKPWGKTPYGLRVSDDETLAALDPTVMRARFRWRAMLAIAGVLILGMLALHLAGGGMSRH